MTQGVSASLGRADRDDTVLTDGEHELRGPAIAAAVESLVDQLRTHGVGPADVLEFCCEHDLASALLWFALLDAGLSAFVNASDPRLPQAEAPGFCRLRVRARWDAALTLTVEVRPAWNGARVPGEPRLIFRTSGTTGTAKYVVHSARQLWRNAMNCVDRLQLRPEDRLVIPVPIYHMYGLGAAFLPGALAGASMELQRASNVLRYAERERVFQPTVAFLTPTFMESLVAGRRGARPYRLTVVAGDLLKPEVCDAYEARFGPVVSLYGSTELGAIAAASPLDPPEVRAHTVGRPMPGVECRLDGQLWCRHPHGFDGYADEHGNVQLQRPDAWFPTSDRAEWRDGEWLRILGRVDHSVNRDGILVALADVEAAMLQIAGVAGVTAVVAGTSARGRGLVAFCTLAPDAQLDAADVRRACLERMPRNQVPDRVELLAALPRLPSGKADRLALARMAEAAGA